MKLDSYLIPYIKVNSKRIKDLNIKNENYKTFRKKKGKSFITFDWAMISWI